eukprot:3400128-Prorocentrum_lima.AAC.1
MAAEAVGRCNDANAKLESWKHFKFQKVLRATSSTTVTPRSISSGCVRSPHGFARPRTRPTNKAR